MIKVKIGDKEFEQYETAEDLPIYRYKVLKEYIIWKETKVDKASLVDTIRGFVAGFDNNSKSQMLITLNNYFVGLQQPTEPDQMIFSLITLEEGEDENRYDEGFLIEKLDRFNELGLTQGHVEEAVNSFLKGSQAHFVSYFQKNLESLPVEEPVSE